MENKFDFMKNKCFNWQQFFYAMKNKHYLFDLVK